MSKYKVLLVDDEEDVRQAIVRKLDWESLGFEVAGEAGNGQEALEMAERLEPDVIMTDIKMPFMDGLELCRRVKQLLPGTRVAVFSGFDEFEYAKEAITQQVEEYILKPIDAEELAGVFRRLRRTLDEEIAQRRDLERLRQHYEQSLPLMRQQLLVSLLGGQLQPGVAQRQLAEYGLDISADGYCVAVVRHDREDDARPQLLDFSLRQLIGEALAGSMSCHLIGMSDRTVLLFLLEAGQGVRTVTGRLGQLFPLSKKLLGARLSIGVGSVYARPDGIAQSYREACGALEYQLLVDPGQCIYIGDIEPGAAADRPLDDQYAHEVLRQIRIGSEQELGAAIDAMIAHLKQAQAGIEQYQIYLLELFTELLKLIRTYRMDPAEAQQDKLLLENTAFKLATLDEIGRWLLGYCNNLRVLARRERKDSLNLLIEQAKAILQEQYADSELSLESVCARLNVSPAYFSTVFKKETGLGFVAYLTELRMRRAVDLLATTDDKTYQIAEKTGYADPNYFSYVFKKHFGVAPSKYKTDRMIPSATT